VKSFQQKLQRVPAEPIVAVDDDPTWPDLFAAEAAGLMRRSPEGVMRRVGHIGSTTVPGEALMSTRNSG
jgi:GrpB-like predicted nucleotidyltransferase (UPF0157 family)